MSEIIKHSCFVAMPFQADLNYFYLYLKDYLNKKHTLSVERGDHRILTKPVLEKIRQQIINSDVILGDITGRNANVFYELGMADVYKKPVILMTQDDVKDIPTDIKHLEFIRYNLENHIEFLSKIDNAIHNVFAERFSPLYDEAASLLERFNKDCGETFEQATMEEFQIRLVEFEGIQSLPAPSDVVQRAECLLPRIVKNTNDANVMKALMNFFQKLK